MIGQMRIWSRSAVAANAPQICDGRDLEAETFT